ncbi:hypothetical protein O6H91_07G022400 [Diphasiastrum complanatum]|uniref:Uncharacterized protein n=1 Tax=Diphasiastrum complanatum TaxID=34168 RepID=A0ACC2D405_DIPCM|nr:hypothetical protein O6H91_07G022400 [Diphasiastrum complanatum]
MSDEAVKEEATRLLNAFDRLPRLVVFDLDYTVWPFWCSKHDKPSMYPHVSGIIKALREKGVALAVASRSPTPGIAIEFIKKLGLSSTFSAVEIFSSQSFKAEHFQRIQQKTGIPYSSMLFFDDETGNIRTVSKMGVTSILVNHGVDLDALNEGLTRFATST